MKGVFSVPDRFAQNMLQLPDRLVFIATAELPRGKGSQPGLERFHRLAHSFLIGDRHRLTPG